MLRGASSLRCVVQRRLTRTEPASLRFYAGLVLCQVQKVRLESALDTHDSLFLEGDALPALQLFYEL